MGLLKNPFGGIVGHVHFRAAKLWKLLMVSKFFKRLFIYKFNTTKNDHHQTTNNKTQSTSPFGGLRGLANYSLLLPYKSSP